MKWGVPKQGLWGNPAPLSPSFRLLTPLLFIIKLTRMSWGGSPWKEKGKDQTEIRFLLRSLHRGQAKGFIRGKETGDGHSDPAHGINNGSSSAQLTLAAFLRNGLGPNSAIIEGQKKTSLCDVLLCFIMIHIKLLVLDEDKTLSSSGD